MSGKDIEPGSIWFNEISDNIETSKFGILCITKENRKEPWLLWEAGALYRGYENVNQVIPLLINIKKDEIPPVLQNFHVISAANKADILSLLTAINKRTPLPLDEALLKTSFEHNWLDLKKTIDIATQTSNKIAKLKSDCKYTFEEAAQRFLQEPGKQQSSTDRDKSALLIPRAIFGHFPLDRISDQTLRSFREDRLKGTIRHSSFKRPPRRARPTTLNKELRTIGAILNRAANVWNWIPSAPKIRSVPEGDKKTHYALSTQEQVRLFELIPDYALPASLIALHSGARKGIIQDLEWSWYSHPNGMQHPMFIIPSGYHGFQKNRNIFLNKISAEIIKNQRNLDKKYVFTGKHGGPFLFYKVIFTAWKKANLPTDDSYSKSVDNLRATFRETLKVAGIPSDHIDKLQWVTKALNDPIYNENLFPKLEKSVKKIESLAHTQSHPSA